MKRLMVMCLAVAAGIGSVLGADFNLKDGATDWSSGGSYAGGSAPTSSGDSIVIAAGQTNVLTSTDVSYAASIETINKVGSVKLMNEAGLIINIVSSAATNTITSLVKNGGTKKGYLIKRGAGTLLQEPTDGGSVYGAYWIVEGGTLGCMWSQKSAGSYLYCSGLDVWAGATFCNCYSAGLLVQGPLTGAGDIVTVNPTNNKSHLFIAGGTPETCFAGRICQNIRVTVYSGGKGCLTGTESTFTGQISIGSFTGDLTGSGVLGFVKFGDSESDSSSLGCRSNVSLGDGNYGTTGCLRYLGTGETVTRKSVYYAYTKNAPATFDGGPYGGLVFSGDGMSWQNQEGLRTQRLCLTGSNTTACVIDCPILEDSAPTYLIKGGSGIWELKENERTTLSGALRVEDGTLRYNSLAARGTRCALGTSANLYAEGNVLPADATPVDYAVQFGGVGLGMLEYTGLYDALCTDRPIEVATGGGFGTAGGAVRINGITAGTDDATLVLTATNDAVCVYGDISDGTKGGRLGVTKRGAGTVELNRDLSFSGPLKVESGKLLVCNSSGPFTWFRLTIKETYGNRENLVTPDDSSARQVVCERFALYDADGVRQNVGFARHDGNLNVGGYWGGGGHAVKSPSFGLRPGEVGYDRVGNVISNLGVTPNYDIDAMCDAVSGDGRACYTQYAAGDVRLDNESGWVPFVFRLTNGAPEIVSFDLAAREGFSPTATSKNRFYCPTAWSLEGSVDGLAWETLTNMQWTAESAGYGCWYSDNASCYRTKDGRKWQDGKSFPVRGRPLTPVAFNVLGNCSSVEVAKGAVLEKAGSEAVTINGLKVAQDGFGTIDGFAFAEEGELEISGELPSGEINIPGKFENATDLANLASWSVVNGTKTKRRRIVPSESGLKILPDGLCVILR